MPIHDDVAHHLRVYLAATGIVAFDFWVAWPRIQRLRAEYIDHADEPEIAFNAGSHTDVVRMPYAEFERLAQPELLWLAHVM